MAQQIHEAKLDFSDATIIIHTSCGGMIDMPIKMLTDDQLIGLLRQNEQHEAAPLLRDELERRQMAKEVR